VTGRRRLIGLRGRFALWVLGGVAVVSAALAGLSYYESSQQLIVARRAQLLALARSQARELSRRLESVAGVARHLAIGFELQRPTSEAQIVHILQANLRKNPGVFGMAVAFAPYVFRPGVLRFAPYVYRRGAKLVHVSIAGPRHDYLIQNWYLIPSLLRRPVWTEPYYDEGGGKVIMTTYSAPVIEGGRVTAVVTADVSLNDLEKTVRSLKVGRTGYGFVLTRWGTFLAAPKKRWIIRESIFSLAERLKLPGLRRIGRTMLRGRGGVVPVRDWLTGRSGWLAYAPVGGGDWTFGVIMTRREVLAPVWRLARVQFLLAAGSLLVLVAVVWLLVVGLTRPLQRLTASAKALSGGDLSVRVEGVRPGDEVGDLAEAFNAMGGRLTEYLDRIKQETAARQALASEIEIARQIQESLLPRTWPPFPEHTEFSLCGHNLAARQVAGDFYDFFLVDDDRLVLIIADVSGKGVPAALFMAVTRTLFRDICAASDDPAAALAQANRVLSQENDACMFVTMIVAYYWIGKGKLVYANAGHDHAVLLGAGGRTELFGRFGDVPLGVTDDYEFQSGEVDLAPGDTVVFFTDGVTEAPSSYGDQFGQRRLLDHLNKRRQEGVDHICHGLVETARDFQPSEIFDDITVMVLRRENGSVAEAGRELTVDADLSHLPRITDFVSRLGVEAGLGPDQILQLQLAVEEVVTNIVKFAYAEGGGRITVIGARVEPGELTIEVIDQGSAFNPLEVAPPDLTAGLQERPIGGLGITLLRRLVDEVRYRREPDQNVLTLVKRQ
jgi:sigma-B regulation protein RsbU (phosphoserine phosphatase)